MPMRALLRRQRPAGTADDRVAELHRRRRPGISKPATSRSSVVLPQPDGPSSAKNSPSAMSRLDALDRAGRAELLRHRLEAHARHGTTPSGRLRASRLVSIASASVTTIEMVATAAAAGELPS